MATVIANHLEQMKNDVVQFSDSLERMHATSRKAFEELESLTGMWEGNANETFRSQFLADSENLENLYQFLRRYCEELNKDYERYTRCEEDIRGMIQSIQI